MLQDMSDGYAMQDCIKTMDSNATNGVLYHGKLNHPARPDMMQTNTRY